MLTPLILYEFAKLYTHYRDWIPSSDTHADMHAQWRLEVWKLDFKITES